MSYPSLALPALMREPKPPDLLWDFSWKNFDEGLMYFYYCLSWSGARFGILSSETHQNADMY
jgi:hypothetical protein